MYATIDIGGTAIKYGVCDREGRFLEKGERATEAKTGGGPGIVEKVRALVLDARKRHELEGIALSTAGMVDPVKGTILYSLPDSIPDYTGTEWKALLEAEFGVPCTVENDVNCAALGECWKGAGRGARSLFAMTIGTSVGGALILEGHVLHGASQSAGEVAYMLLPGGRLHDLASATALVQHVEQAKGLSAGSLDGRKVFQMISEGDAASKEALDALCASLADGITNIVCVANPEVILLGGGIMAQEAIIRPVLEKALESRLVPRILAATRLAFAERGNDAGMLGALCYHLTCTGKA